MIKFRRLNNQDKELYFEFASLFYNSEAVLHPVPIKNLEATFNELIRSNDYLECFFFEDGGKAVGFALLAKAFSQESGGKVIWIEEIYILPEYRSKGIGSEFFNYMEKEFPVSRFRLEVEEDNISAMRLYEKLGYKKLPYLQMVKDENDEKNY